MVCSRCRLQHLFYFIIAVLLIIYINLRIARLDVHQLTVYNTEEHPSWASYTYEIIENIYNNAIALVYDKEDACQDCMKIDFPVLLQPSNICGKDGPEILILIFSSPADKDSRMSVRKTWLSGPGQNTDDIQHAFLLGRSPDDATKEALTKENSQYMDLLQFDFEDNHRNFTLKTINGFRWAAKHCPGAQYVMKVDTDIYLNIPKWWRLMFGPNKEQLQKVVFGHCRRNSAVFRTPFHRYRTSLTSLSASRQASYCRGPAYALSYKLIKEVANFSYKVRFIPVEDAYVGKVVKALGYKVYNPPDIRIQDLYEIRAHIKQNPCSLKRDLYVIHAVKSEELLDLWQLASQAKC